MEEIRIFLEDRGAQIYLFVVFLAIRGCLIRYYNCSDNRKASSSSTSKSTRPSFLPILLSLVIISITWFYIFRFIFTNIHASESYFNDAYRDVLKDEGQYGISTQLLTWAIIAVLWMGVEGTLSDLYFLGFGFLGAMSASFVLWVPSLYRRKEDTSGRKTMSIFSALCAAVAFVCILNLHPCSKDEKEECDEDKGFGSFQPSFQFWLHSLHYVLILPVLVSLLPFRLPRIDAAVVYGVLAVTLSVWHISLLFSSGKNGIAHALAEPMTDCQLSITTDLVCCSFITLYAIYQDTLLLANAGLVDSKTDSTKPWSTTLFRTSFAMLSLPLVSPAAVLAFHLCLHSGGASYMAAVSWLQQWMANRIRGERPCRLEVDTISSDTLNRNGHNGNGHSGGVSGKTRKALDQGPRWCNLGLWNDGDNGDCDPLGGYDEACERLALALGSAAGLTTTDTVLCCGCGSGAELGLYKDRFRLRHITGFDPDFDLAAERKRSCYNEHDPNIRRMRARVEDLHQSAGAGSLFPPTYFSKILALDNVYHYTSKLNFFRDCANMLPPGGKVGVTDILLVKGATPIWVRLALRILGISVGNLWTQGEYIKHMSNLGFVDIKIESIGRRVFLGWKHFLPEALSRHLEYAIIVGTRPPLPPAKETKQKRVAIVGSGLSGLMAAHTIANSSRGANVAVTIFEANDRPGLAGYSDSYEGHLIDVPPRMAAEGYYKQYRELLNSLEIPTAVVRTDCTYYGEDERDGTNAVHAYYDKSRLVNLYFAVFVGGLSKFWRMVDAMSNIDKDLRDTHSMPLFGDWLDRYFHGYSSSSAPSKSHGNTSVKFNENPFLSLFVGSLGWMLSCTYIQLMEYPVDVILPYIHGLYSSNSSSLLELLFGGGQVVRVVPSIKALEQVLLYGVDMKCGARVTGVDERKVIDGVSYDAVIIATEACAVPKVLRNGPKVFSKIKYHPSTIYLHKDESFMPPNKKDWRCWNVELKSGSDEPQLTFWLNEFYPDSKFSTNVFQTWAPLRTPKSELIVKKYDFQRVVHTSATREMVSEIESEQGKGRIYYAGSYCVYGMGLLEQALISGRKTAEDVLEELFG